MPRTYTPRPRPLANPPGRGGRKQGSTNKSTVAIRAGMLAVFAELQARAGRRHGHLRAWAEGDATEFYKLISRLLPRQVEGRAAAAPAITRVDLVAVPPDDRAAERTRATSARPAVADRRQGEDPTIAGVVQFARFGGDITPSTPSNHRGNFYFFYVPDSSSLEITPASLKLVQKRTRAKA